VGLDGVPTGEGIGERPSSSGDGFGCGEVVDWDNDGDDGLSENKSSD
jgi:hypothetical protein